MRGRFRGIAAAFCAAALTLGLSGCDAESSAFGSTGGPTITIGIVDDEPGLSVLRGGEYEGLDIDVAEYIARNLGYADKQITYMTVDESERDDLLTNGEIDMMVGYSGTGTPSTDVEYAGTYLEDGHDLLIRGDDAQDITGPSSMDGRIACTAQDAPAAETLQQAEPGVTIEERDSYSQCVTAVMIGEADAVAADSTVLAGFAAEFSDGYLTVVDQPYADSWRGVAVRGGSTELASRVSDALTAMVDDGTWSDLTEQLTEQTGYAS